ncbi:relaxase/mobilization nuclease domain-containing protein [Jutongia sp.]|uniref:relaxase/mobilization nuclease domain-containing protein n=1 Tax=Jutongia sp. TaxID=2944204 RepID=UPI00307A9A3A
MEGIVAKIWNIKEGTMGRGAAVQITDSISYITNSEKCDGVIVNDDFMQVGREVSYVINDIKTLQGLYVGGRHISDIQNATNEMMQVKEFHNKLGGRVALHGIVSLPVGESGKENAGKLMMLADNLLEEIFPDHQAIYAVHTNTENLHVHFVVNTVALNGRKIHMDHNFMSKVFDPYLNKLARQYGFSPNMAWEEEKEPDEIKFSDRVIKLRQIVDTAIEWSDDFDSFLHNLRSQGIQVNCGKYLSLRMDGMPRAIRSFKLGSRYTIDAIRDRLLGKREELIRSEVGDHIFAGGSPAQIYVKTTPLKKYADMDAEEKKEAIRMLKLGRNPWREQYKSNWQLQRIAEEFHRTANIYELIRTYAPDTGNVNDALRNIIRKQKEIAEEKKAVKTKLRDYKPIIDLYKEAVKHEKRAYLYEFAGCDEYLSDYLEYKMLVDRLEKGYSKTINEVAAYVEEEENQILYAKAQAKELSSAYHTILRFAQNELRQQEAEYMSLYEAIGYAKARTAAVHQGVFESSIKYIAADSVDDGYIRVVILPDIVGGTRTVTATVSAYDKNGELKKEFSSKEANVKEFNQNISELKADMGFYRCHIFDSADEARALMKAQEEKKEKNRIKN